MLDKLQRPFKGRKGRPELVDVLKKTGGDDAAAIQAAEQVAAGLPVGETGETEALQPADPVPSRPVPVPAPAPPQPTSKKRNAKPTPQPATVQPAEEKPTAPIRRRG
jgi:hypothetical protein